MSWRVAASLEQLLAEINSMAPGRNKASDGSIGDADHSARESDHNPCTEHSENPGVVCARDFTHDPAHGFDSYGFARWLAPRMASGAEDRCKYIISNRQIASASSSPPWSFRAYDGSNPHTSHVHVSVAHPASLYDDRSTWSWSGELPPPTPATVPAFPFPAGHWMGVASSNPKNHSGYYSADQPGIRQYQQRMRDRGWTITVDGLFGSQSRGVTMDYQQEKGLAADGLAGEQTWQSIWTAPVT